MLSSEATGEAPARGRLTEGRVLVVGAGTQASAEAEAPLGNGRAIAVLAAREGAAVACADIDSEAAAATVALAAAEPAGAKAVAITADVADPEQCAAMVEEAQSSLGGLDGLVLNVGIGRGAGLKGTSVEDWDLALDVNLRAHFLICKAALPLMADGGAIVLMSSVAGMRAGSRSPSYDSSKAALFGLCRHVAREGVARGVRVNTVTPGLIDTPLGRAAKARNPSRAGGESRVPMRREGTAWEIAYATVFLLSGEASYVTGQTLVVDGGLTT
jgi:NAD(P)-dependent dehydrogenase (short-subunit alcohol dehydrogenase family)